MLLLPLTDPRPPATESRLALPACRVQTWPSEAGPQPLVVLRPAKVSWAKAVPGVGAGVGFGAGGGGVAEPGGPAQKLSTFHPAPPSQASMPTSPAATGG